MASTGIPAMPKTTFTNDLRSMLADSIIEAGKEENLLEKTTTATFKHSYNAKSGVAVIIGQHQEDSFPGHLFCM